MKGRVLSYGCACLCSGEGIPALSLPRDMPYSKDTSSCSVNHLLKRFAGSRFMACLYPRDARVAFSSCSPGIFYRKAKNTMGWVTPPGWAWKPDRLWATLLYLCPLGHGATLSIMIFVPPSPLAGVTAVTSASFTRNFHRGLCCSFSAKQEVKIPRYFIRNAQFDGCF